MPQQQDEIFKAMADPHRRQILGELCRQSREAGELARMVGLAPNAMSFHLRALKAADLVSVRREGRFLRYSLEPMSLLGWRSQVDRLFPAHLLREQSTQTSAPDDMDAAAVLEPDSHQQPGRNQDQLPTELL